MSTTYINRTGHEQWALSSAGFCPWCATEDIDGCLARYCDSCSAYWMAETGNDNGEGRPVNETCPDCLIDGQNDWKLYSEYQVPIGCDPWPWYHRMVWRALMFVYERTEWYWVWRVAQPFREPPMQYKAKYHEMKVLKKDGSNITVDNAERLTNGAPVFAKVPEGTHD